MWGLCLYFVGVCVCYCGVCYCGGFCLLLCGGSVYFVGIVFVIVWGLFVTVCRLCL